MQQKIETREYQQRLVTKALNAYAQGLKSVLLESPTGSGKTIMGLLILKKLQELDPEMSFGWVTMRRKLLLQAKRENERVGVNNISFVSMFDKNPPHFKFMVSDECQHDAAASSADMHKVSGAGLSLGLTATPFRTDRVKLSFDKVISDCGVRFLIESGFLSQFKQWVIPKWTPQDVAKHYLLSPDRWGKSVIYMKTLPLCFETMRILQEGGVTAEVIHGAQSRQEQDDIYERFEDGVTKVLINVYLLTEGFDAPDLQTVFVRDSGKLCTMQMCLDSDTEILTSSGWKKDGGIDVGDQVAALDLKTNNIEWTPVLEIISRDLGSTEEFISLKNPHLDLRVTDQHDLIYRSKKSGAWLKKTATSLAEKRQPYRIPVSGIMQSSGVGLSNEQLELLGLWLTDGSLDTGLRSTRKKKYLTLKIYQSVKSLQHSKIVSVLERCGLPVNYMPSPPRKGRLSKYPPNSTYSVSQRWLPNSFLDFVKDGKKSCLDRLEPITEQQMTFLLEGMQIGDGKKRETANYTPRTLCLCLGNDKSFIDKFQSLCVRKGYRCNLSYYEFKPNEWNLKGECGWLAYVKKQRYSVIGGKTKNAGFGNRCSLRKEGHTGKTRVWCIRNAFGSIIIRRNGKVAIVGNCGRVLRKDPNNGKKVANIVQSEETWYPYTKVAKASEEFVWQDESWRSISASELMEKMSQIVRERILTLPIMLPSYLDSARGHLVRVSNKGKVTIAKRRKRGTNQTTAALELLLQGGSPYDDLPDDLDDADLEEGA